jgi:uncharacterized lipoprotein YehR (DUF1307 family)
MNCINMEYRLYTVVAIILLALTLTGCSKSPQEHFRSNQSGVSADYGIFWDGNPDPDDHVVTVHGFWDDRSVCEEVVKMLENMSTKGQSYSCIKLN